MVGSGVIWGEATGELRALAESAGTNRATLLSGLWGYSITAATAAIAHGTGRPILLVCGHIDEADDLADDVELFAGERPEVLVALEEQVVLMRLLGETGDSSTVTVRIGTENPDLGLRSTSVVAADYGVGDLTLARLGVLGPTRMDYPSTMGAVRAVARYVGQILAGS